MIVGYDYVALVALFITAAAVTDYRTRKIPNWLTYPAFIAGLALHYDAIGPALISVAIAAEPPAPMMFWTVNEPPVTPASSIAATAARPVWS